MENLKNELGEAGTLPRFLIRYVDDVLAIIKKEEIEPYLEKLNRMYSNIEFTTEIEKERKEPILDLKIIRKGGDFDFDIYRQLT